MNAATRDLRGSYFFPVHKSPTYLCNKKHFVPQLLCFWELERRGSAEQAESTLTRLEGDDGRLVLVQVLKKGTNIVAFNTAQMECLLRFDTVKKRWLLHFNTAQKWNACYFSILF